MAHIDISILGQQYKISCPAGEESALQKSVEQFNDKLHTIKSGSRNLRNEQVMVLAALNFCHELNLEKAKNEEYIDQLNNRIQDIQDSIDTVISKSN
ncbi:MAG: cell division protein ZapA [Psychromonas sp.]